jgi:hemoglobin
VTGTTSQSTSSPALPYQRIGGAGVIRLMVDHFYDLMDSDPAYARLRAIHADDLAPMRDSLAGFLNGWMGGPRDWFGNGKCVMSAHAPFVIDADLRDQWLSAMRRAMTQISMEADVRQMLDDGFTRVASAMVRP